MSKLYQWQIEDCRALVAVGASREVIKRDCLLTNRDIELIIAKYGVPNIKEGDYIPSLNIENEQPGIQLEDKEQVIKRIMKDFSDVDDLLSDL